jgi:hypothetical protein
VKTHDLPASPIRFEEEGNPHYPLPPDYPVLSEDGKRKARLNALCLRETPMDYVRAWSLFCRYYLESLEEGSWYQPPFYPSAPFHYAMVHDYAAYPFNLYIYPRGYAKSTRIRELVMLDLLTTPYLPILVVKVGETHIADMSDPIRYQIENNERIIFDFGVQKPPRAHGSWSSHRFSLVNRASADFRPIKGAVLGKRPRKVIMDDAEYDPVLDICPSDLTDHVEKFVFGALRPMLRRGGSMLIAGTLFNRKTFVYRFSQMGEDDERAAYWNRCVYSCYDEEGNSIWPEAHSLADLRDLERQLTPAVFAAQYLNAPGTSDDRLLRVHPKMSAYMVREHDDLLPDRPLLSQSKLVSWVRKSEKSPIEDSVEIERDFGQTVSRMHRVALVDPARGQTKKHDFSAIIIVGREHSETYHDTLWVLEAWQGKVPEAKLLDQIWYMSARWRVRVIGIEALSVQQSFVDRCVSDYLVRAEKEQWMPRVFPVTYAGEIKRDKGTRLAGMCWRYEQFRIKFPLERRDDKYWKDLFHQIEHFTEDLSLLDHDDMLDALHMYPYVVRPKGKYTEQAPDVSDQPLERLKRGQLVHPRGGYRIADAFNASEIPLDVAEQMIAARLRSDEARRRAGFVRIKGTGLTRRIGA